MREILFRGKRVDNGKWVYGCYIKGVKACYGKAYILPDDINQDGCHYLDGFEVIPESVGQFTGLTDKNKTKIFEDDILVGYKGGTNHDMFYRGVLRWQKDQAGWIIESGKYIIEILSLSMSGGNDCICLLKFEIIGNIHDNPELLDEKA